jgi:hypothetical protein
MRLLLEAIFRSLPSRVGARAGGIQQGENGIKIPSRVLYPTSEQEYYRGVLMHSKYLYLGGLWKKGLLQYLADRMLSKAENEQIKL